MNDRIRYVNILYLVKKDLIDKNNFLESWGVYFRGGKNMNIYVNMFGMFKG